MEYSDSTQDSVSVLASVKIHLPSPTGYVYEESVLMAITRLTTECLSACVIEYSELRIAGGGVKECHGKSAWPPDRPKTALCTPDTSMRVDNMGASEVLTNIAPGYSKTKRFIVRANFFVLGRGFQAASRFDSQVKKEISDWDEGFTVIMRVRPRGPSMAWRKSNSRMKYIGSKAAEADLTIAMKNLESAFLMMTAQIGTPQAYAQHRLGLEGNIADAMTLTRCLNSVEAYLFPKFICKRILKRPPKMGVKRHCTRFLIYLLGIVFGV